MLTQNQRTGIKGRYFDIAKKHLCPECRSKMTEVDRITEHGVSFIWYECTRDGCNGQWLEKTTAKMEVA